MTEIRRRIDLKKVQEIKDFLAKCNDSLLSYENTMFAEYKQIPDATRLEHAAAHYPLFASNGKKRSINADVIKQHDKEVREFNKSLKDMDIEIGGVEHEFEDVFGNKFSYVFVECLYDVQAKKRSDREKRLAQGHMEKSKRCDEIANNKGLKKQHDLKMRAIRRLLDRKGKKE